MTKTTISIQVLSETVIFISVYKCNLELHNVKANHIFENTPQNSITS